MGSYEVGAVVGTGAYAVVKSAYCPRTQRTLALKVYLKSSLQEKTRRASVDTEIRVLGKLDHPNIIKLHEVIDSPAELVLVLELVPGDSLYALLKQRRTHRLSELEARPIFGAVVSALVHCHAQQISHRDVKLNDIGVV